MAAAIMDECAFVSPIIMAKVRLSQCVIGRNSSEIWYETRDWPSDVWSFLHQTTDAIWSYKNELYRRATRCFAWKCEAMYQTSVITIDQIYEIYARYIYDIYIFMIYIYIYIYSLFMYMRLYSLLYIYVRLYIYTVLICMRDNNIVCYMWD